MMKTTTLLICALFFAFGLSANVPKMVLYEGFTSASCGPCYAQDPAINGLAEANLDKVVPIKYHVSWFGPDPMNAHNPSEVTARTGYYSVNSTPNRRVNGQDIAFSQFNIDGQHATSGADFELVIDASLDEAWEELSVTVDVIAHNNVTASNLKLRIAVVERSIVFDQPPGSTPATNFFYVMKKFLPNVDGLNLAPPFQPGDELSYNQSWTLDNVYSEPELSIVAFIQSDNDRTVYQAAVSNVNIPVPHDLDAAITNIRITETDYANDDICDFHVEPSIQLRNEGNDALTSAHIRYKVNDGSYRYLDWTGNLQTFQSVWVQLPGAAFFPDPSGVNTIVADVHYPNGSADENPDNTVFDKTFNTAPNTSGNIQFTLDHDQYTDEIHWELKNSSGDVLYSGGGYPDMAVGTKQYTFGLSENDCYTFFIYDDYGDGILGTNRGVTLTDLDNNNILIQHYADYGFEGRVRFGVNADQTALFPDSTDVFTTVHEPEIVRNINVFPNPASDVLNVEVETFRQSDIRLQIVDITGRVIDNAIPRDSRHQFNISELPAGMYFVRIMDYNKVIAVSKFIRTN